MWTTEVRCPHAHRHSRRCRQKSIGALEASARDVPSAHFASIRALDRVNPPIDSPEEAEFCMRRFSIDEVEFSIYAEPLAPLMRKLRFHRSNCVEKDQGRTRDD